MVRSNERNYLRAWREHRGLTQAKLAEAVGTTGAVISLLESGERGLSDKWLRKLAPVLRTRPGHLLEVDPADVDDDLRPHHRRGSARACPRALGRVQGLTIRLPGGRATLHQGLRRYAGQNRHGTNDTLRFAIIHVDDLFAICDI